MVAIAIRVAIDVESHHGEIKRALGGMNKLPSVSVEKIKADMTRIIERASESCKNLTEGRFSIDGIGSRGVSTFIRHLNFMR